MANTCTIIRKIEIISQKIADFLSKPLTSRAINRIFDKIELLRGAVRELPLSKKPKRDILDRLAQAQRLLKNGNLNGAVSRILAVLSILQVVVLKVKSRPIPCAQGLTIVHPSKPFSTICKICDC